MSPQTVLLRTTLTRAITIYRIIKLKYVEKNLLFNYVPVRGEELHRPRTNWRIHTPYSLVLQTIRANSFTSCVVWGGEKCEQWVKCPRVLSVDPLTNIYYSITIFGCHFKCFIRWMIWNRDTTVQYAFYSAVLSHTFSSYMVKWCSSVKSPF